MTVKTSEKNLKSVFKNNREITFTKGIYKITDTIQLYSDTVIDLNGATLRRHCSKPVLMTYATATTKRYDGVRNVVIKNGTIEGMNGYGYSPSNMVALFHARNIVFENVTFLDATGSHCVDIVGCDNVTIKNCKFLGYCSAGNDFRESIQIDSAFAGGLPYFDKKAATYDLTTCRNITIESCKFDKSSTYPAQYMAIGTHEQVNSSEWNENIIIRGNTARGNGVSGGAHGSFFKMMNFRNIIVEDNTVDNYGRFVYCHMPTKLRNKDNTTVEAKKANTVQNLTIVNNKVNSVGYTYRASGVYIEDKFGTAKNILVNNLSGVVTNYNTCIYNCKNVEVD